MSKTIQAEYVVTEESILAFAQAKGYEEKITENFINDEGQSEQRTIDNPIKAETFFSDIIKEVLTREISSVAISTLRQTKRQEEATEAQVIKDNVKDDLIVSVK